MDWLQSTSPLIFEMIRQTLRLGTDSPEIRSKLFKPEKNRIMVKVSRKNHQLSMTIKDDGPGRSPEQIAELQAIQGQIIKLGGKLGITNQANKGTVIQLDLLVHSQF
jgi:chemotaxis protein histidine kinase CheA